MKFIAIFSIFLCLSCSNLSTIKQLNTKNKGINKHDNIPGYQHHDALWFEKDKHETYSELATYLYNNFIKKNNYKTILELGSGSGSLAYFLRQLDPSLIVITVDGNKKTYKSPYIKSKHHFIARTDKDLEFVINKKRVIFDFVISFEHLEHIQHENFYVLLDNLKKHMNNSTLCLCSAANWSVWGGDLYKPHCNVKTLQEWEVYLQSQGFEMLDTSELINVPSPFNFEWNNTHKLLFRLATQ